jgi:hypothetical protein
MDNNINFKQIWQSQTAAPIPSQELLLKVTDFKKSASKKIITTLLLFIATLAAFALLWWSNEFEMLTTPIGIGLMILAMAMYGYNIRQQYPLLQSIDSAASNAEYLKNLIAFKKKQQFLQTTMLSGYFVLLSLGLGLYLIEPCSYMTVNWKIIAYLSTFIWILFNWFYLRPWQIKKQNAKINEIISTFETINNQLEQGV